MNSRSGNLCHLVLFVTANVSALGVTFADSAFSQSSPQYYQQQPAGNFSAPQSPPQFYQQQSAPNFNSVSAPGLVQGGAQVGVQGGVQGPFPGAAPSSGTPYPTGWPSGPGQLPPQISGNIWQSVMVNRVSAGTILQGTMHDTISSKSSNVGDTFAIDLDQGYSWQDKLVIPVGTKVLGSIIAVNPAKKMMNGAPGNLQVSIQKMVFPDGRTAPLSAFMQMRPNTQNNTQTNQDGKLDNKIPLASYANSAKGMGVSALSNVTRVFGVRLAPQRVFKSNVDFSISQGEQIALKLTRTFDLANLSLPPGGIATPGNEPNGPLSSPSNPSPPGAPSSTGAGPAPGEPF
jgi:hypothetical protein